MRRSVRLAVLMLPGALACCLAAGACSRPEAPFVPRQVAAVERVDPAQPCTRAAQPGGEQPTPSAGSGSGSESGSPVRATFNAGVITVSAGQGVTLRALSRAVGKPDALREVSPGQWLLGVDLVVAKGASLRISAPEVQWLKLRSEPGRFASIKALGGGLDIRNTCITTWDTTAQRADTEPTDGRGFLLARDGAQMTIDHAELRYLGYGAVESYGLSWRTQGTTGSITNSVVSHLYYGLYSNAIEGLVVRDNEFYSNVLYGIDPHTGSRNLRIEHNVVHDNGKHGIILAEDCTDSVISNNIVYRNGHHGIVLYQRSDRNTVEQNESFLNASQGININESSEDVVRGNRVYQNGESGIGVGQTAQRNVVESNEIRLNQQDGVRLVSEAAQNAVRGNVIGGNARYGVYVDGDGGFDMTANKIFGSQVGVLLKGTDQQPASNNQL
ncbi:MAG TPA: right-handed parallel beta-helix repeat-containing protein, partial [Pseudonocardia sp.]|nr:right-handed parallel beta-helix repeat-containing protein [Pseudonocardia sp.]